MGLAGLELMSSLRQDSQANGRRAQEECNPERECKGPETVPASPEIKHIPHSFPHAKLF